MERSFIDSISFFFFAFITVYDIMSIKLLNTKRKMVGIYVITLSIFSKLYNFFRIPDFIIFLNNKGIIVNYFQTKRDNYV